MLNELEWPRLIEAAALFAKQRELPTFPFASSFSGLHDNVRVFPLGKPRQGAGMITG